MHELFIAGLGLGLAALFYWAFKTLPAPGWQFIGATPRIRSGDGCSGVSFTWYGFFAATAYTVGCGLALVLLGSVGVPLRGSLLALVAILAVCVPMSSLIARWVEGSRHGFTVGGASFAGMCISPGVFGALGQYPSELGFGTPVTACLAAVSIAYVLGEGIGRISCISFGCCYGKPIEEARGWVRSFSRRHHFVFIGPTKKIAFASGLEGVPVVPVQAMTASLHACIALAGLWLFFEGLYGWAVTWTLLTSQVWRVYSETFRADYRGSSQITAYQIMASIAVGVGAIAPFVLPDHAGLDASLRNGLKVLWQPLALLSLQGVWLALFLFMGRSTQTGALLQFHVYEDRA